MDRVSHLVRSRQQQYLSLSHSIGLSLSSRLKFHVKKLFWHFNSLSVNLSFKSILFLFPIYLDGYNSDKSQWLQIGENERVKQKFVGIETQIEWEVSFHVVFMHSRWEWYRETENNIRKLISNKRKNGNVVRIGIKLYVLRTFYIHCIYVKQREVVSHIFHSTNDRYYLS